MADCKEENIKKLRRTTFNKTIGLIRLERVNKWSNPLTAAW
jgi:hypothetical protein